MIYIHLTISKGSDSMNAVIHEAIFKLKEITQGMLHESVHQAPALVGILVVMVIKRGVIYGLQSNIYRLGTKLIN